MTTINDLIRYLEGTIDFLKERFDSDQKLKVFSNTYFIHSASHILEVRNGFIDLDNPIGYGEED